MIHRLFGVLSVMAIWYCSSLLEKGFGCPSLEGKGNRQKRNSYCCATLINMLRQGSLSLIIYRILKRILYSCVCSSQVVMPVTQLRWCMTQNCTLPPQDGHCALYRPPPQKPQPIAEWSTMLAQGRSFPHYCKAFLKKYFVQSFAQIQILYYFSPTLMVLMLAFLTHFCCI